ncbi:hypothetical protein JCM5350_001614 [Sporobolomyces pararoseus]
MQVGEETDSGKVNSLDRLMEEVPREYIIDVLKELAPQLIASINCVSIPRASAPSHNEPPPKRQHCIFNPSKRSEESSFSPDCFLALTFPPSPSQPTRLLVPAHSFVYAFSGSPLFPLQSPPPVATSIISQRDSSSVHLDLPVLGPFALPSYRAFVILHSYLHNRSSAQLLRYLLLPTIASTFSRPPSPPPSPTFDSSSACSTPASQDRLVLDCQMKQILELRKTGMALQLSDDSFWKTLQRAYEVVSQR